MKLMLRSAKLRTLVAAALTTVSVTIGLSCLVPGCGWMQSHPQAASDIQGDAVCVLLHLDELLGVDTTQEELAAIVRVATLCKIPQHFVSNVLGAQKQGTAKLEAKRAAKAKTVTSPSATSPSASAAPAASK